MANEGCVGTSRPWCPDVRPLGRRVRLPSPRQREAARRDHLAAAARRRRRPQRSPGRNQCYRQFALCDRQHLCRRVRAGVEHADVPADGAGDVPPRPAAAPVRPRRRPPGRSRSRRQDHDLVALRRRRVFECAGVGVRDRGGPDRGLESGRGRRETRKVRGPDADGDAEGEGLENSTATTSRSRPSWTSRWRSRRRAASTPPGSGSATNSRTPRRPCRRCSAISGRASR